MNLLPAGSVVTLKEATRKIMVIGILISNQDSGDLYDYVGVPYPEGYLNDEAMFLFMHEDIQKVEFIGFVNSEYQSFRTMVEKQLEARNSDSPI